jgi:hypothetical protein
LLIWQGIVAVVVMVVVLVLETVVVVVWGSNLKGDCYFFCDWYLPRDTYFCTFVDRHAPKK